MSAPTDNDNTNLSPSQKKPNPNRTDDTSNNTTPPNKPPTHLNTAAPPSSSSYPSSLSTPSLPTSTPPQDTPSGASTILSGISHPNHYPATVPLASRVPPLGPLLPSTRYTTDEILKRELVRRWEMVYGPGQRLGTAAEEGEESEGAGGATGFGAGISTRGAGAAAGGVAAGAAAIETPSMARRNAFGALQAASFRRGMDGVNEGEGEGFGSASWGKGLGGAEEGWYERGPGTLERKRGDEDEGRDRDWDDGEGGYEDEYEDEGSARDGDVGAVDGEQDGSSSDTMDLVDSEEMRERDQAAGKGPEAGEIDEEDEKEGKILTKLKFD